MGVSPRLIVVKLDLWGENMRKPRLGKLSKSIFALTIAMATLSPVSVNAVTFGNPVDDPLENAPYVVSIWVSEKGDVRQAEFICTGTLISPTIILTAAHCTDFANVSFFVKIKAVALQEETQFYAATPWTGTRYDPGTKVKPPEGDIGLLKINAKITDVTFPSLVTPTIAKLITTKTRLTLMGWGLDQNKKLADTLHYSNLLLQDSSSKKYWGKYFNSKTMISAGKYIKAEKKWSGSCNGDSGGPLLAKLNGINYVVGVTSWGAQECRVEAPSIFSRVSYYEKDIRSGIKAVDLLASKVNRLAPVEVVAPFMQGEGIPGSTLTCNTGSWDNVDKVEISWLSPSRMIGSSIPSTKIIAADAGLEFKCKVLASSKSGDSEATVTRTLTKVLPKKLAVASPPVIGGLEGSEFIKVGSVARCEGWNWAEPVDKEVIQWFTTSTSLVTTPVNGKLIGAGIELPITAEFLKNEKGRYLVCQLTGTREGFPSYLVATKLISTPSSPVINDVYVKSSGLKSGSTATCTYSGGNSQALVAYEWGYTGAGNTFTQFGGQTADFIQISLQIIRLASGQKLACKVTISFLGETTSKVGASQEIFESALEAPKVTLSIPNSLYVGSYVSCSIPSSSKYSSVSYEWGISNTSQFGNFISGVLGKSSSYIFDKDSLLIAAGNYLVCLVTVENEVGKSQGYASGSIAIGAAPALPGLNSFTIASQSKSNGIVTAILSIPSVYGFETSNMEVRLRMSGATCDGTQIYAFPSSITCTGLIGSRSYSGYLEIKYSTNPALASKQSAGTTFTTIDATQAPVISLSNSIQSIAAGTPLLTVTPTNSGGATSVNGYSISPTLPPGLSFSTNTGTISGTPTQTLSQRTYTITAVGTGGSASATFILTITAAEIAPAISLSNSLQSVTVGNAILTVSATNSGGAISQNGFTISPSLPSGLVFSASTGSISGTPTQIASQRSYTVTAAGTGGSANAIFTLTVIAADIAPVISLSNSVQSVTAGNPILSVNATNTGGTLNSNGYSISPTLPSGLVFSTSNGSISGTPTQVQGAQNYSVTATGKAGSSTATFTLAVTAPVSAPVISISNPVQSVTVGNSILTVSPTNSGGAISSNGYSISPALPSGLSFNSATGTISGTPTQVQTQRSYTVTAAGAGGSSNATFTLIVSALPIVTIVAPSQPEINGIVATQNSLSISWNLPISDGGSPITQYWAYVESNSGATVSYCSTTGALSCTATNLTPATTYKVIVSAWNSANGINLSSGNQFSPRTLASTLANPDVTPPTVVSYSGTLSSPSITGQIVSVPSIGNISDGMETNSDFTVTFQVTDNTGVASVILCVDSSSEDRLTGIILNISGVGSYGVNDGRCLPAQLISGNSTSGTYTVTGRFPSVSSLAAMSLGACGRYTVRAQAIDLNGNRSTMTTVRKIDIVTCRR
jgi:secreted trypsin-like serine protease